MTVSTDDETFEAAVANIIPPQRAGRIAQDAGLADKSRLVPGGAGHPGLQATAGHPPGG